MCAFCAMVVMDVLGKGCIMAHFVRLVVQHA